MKKALSLALALVMCLALLPATALAAGPEITWLTETYIFEGNFSEGLAVVKKRSGSEYKYGFIDKTGKLVVPLEYDYAYSFSEGLARVEKDGKWDYIDKTGKVVDNGAYSFSEGLARVQKGGKWGFIEKTGKVVVPLEYDMVWDFSEGLARVRKGGKYGFIDKTGKVVVPLELKYEMVYDFSEGLALVANQTSLEDSIPGYKYGFIDRTGKLVVPLEYNCYDFSYFSFSEGLAVVEKDKKYGFIDKTGKVVVPLGKYDHVYPFSEGLAKVEKSGKSGFIDRTGKVVVPLEYDGAGSFSEGLALVEKGSIDDNYRCGFIDKTGKVVVPLEYGGAGPFSDGVAWVYKDGKQGIMKNPLSAPTVPAASTAAPTNDKLTVNGALQNPTVYKIGGSNYFKIRDLAAVLNGTGKQFDVGYDGTLKSVTATTGKGYAKQSGDLAGAATGGNQTASPSNDTIYIDGKKVDAEVYKIGGSNYFKLRDLGKALNFYVGWEKDTGVFIDTSKPYSE